MIKIRMKGIDETIRHIEEYQKSLKVKQKLMLEKLSEIGVEVATVRFAEAQYDGINDVVVDNPVWEGEDKVLIYARGQTVGFIEFGTGVHYTEVHQEAAKFGAVRGSFGHGLGRLDSWRYPGSPGTNGELITIGKHAGEVLTHGNPPARAMYDAAQEMRAKILEIAKEVYHK